METILLFLFALIFLVVAHELGHFLAARAFGVRVEEFGIGYPPLARKLFTWKGTLFTLNWLPFGGFVKIYGEDDREGVEKRKHSFSQQALWKRLTIVLAGIAANVLLAIVLYAASFSVGFVGIPDQFPAARQLTPVELVVTEVLPRSPAALAGIAAGDVITSVQALEKEALPVNAVEYFIPYIQARGGTAIAMTVVRGGETQTISVIPAVVSAGAKPSIGISIAEAARLRMPFGQALRIGVTHTWQECKDIFGSVTFFLKKVITGRDGAFDGVSGPVGIAKIAGTAGALGLGSFFSFLALISINLAVINLLPFPVLDGGRFILECFSRKGKSHIPEKVVRWINHAGFLLLAALMIYVTYTDIFRLLA